MTSDTIKLGETYDLSVTVNDADGDPITLDGTYSAAYRVNTAIDASGTDIALASITIADGKATASIDTGATENPFSATEVTNRSACSRFKASRSGENPIS
jgi:hypothetical protein